MKYSDYDDFVLLENKYFKYKPTRYKDKIVTHNKQFYCRICDFEEIQNYMNMTDEERKLEISKLRSENHKKFWANIDRTELGNKISEGRNNMSEEDKLRFSQNVSNGLKNRPQEEKEKTSKLISESRKEYFKNMTDKEHEEYSECRKRTWSNKSEEEMKRISDLQKEKFKNKTDEEKEFTISHLVSYNLGKEGYDKEWCKKRYELLKSANAEKYGVENQFQRREVINQIKDTKLEEYGTLSLGVHTNYRYKGIKFDSSHELYFYIYHHDILKDNISRGKHFKYFIDGISHIYECDFLLNGENVEIKGNHLINENMELIDFYGDKHVLTEKTKCLRDNNVKIIIDESEEMQEIIKIVEEKFPNLVESCVMRFTKRELEKLNPKPKVKKSKLKNVDEKTIFDL
jgi:hypothetical protein